MNLSLAISILFLNSAIAAKQADHANDEASAPSFPSESANASAPGGLRSPPRRLNGQGPPVIPGRLIVQFAPNTPESAKANARSKANASSSKKISPSMNPNLELLTVPDARLEHALADLADLVEFVEPDYIVTKNQVPNDPKFTDGSLWGMQAGFGSDAEGAWEIDTGSHDVVIGIIDEGIQTDHEDLADNVWVNPGEIPGNGIDDDGNGYVDDVHGWDFDGNDNSVYDGGTKGSLDDHGTHVAGTIGAVGNNNIGIVGVNQQVEMISAKFLGRRGGSTSGAIAAVDYLTNLKTTHGVNICASNNSWGGGGESQGLYNAIQRGCEANILFVAAAGNSGGNLDSSNSYPAGYGNDCIISVAAIDVNSGMASWSNYGSTTVDIGAPGVNILSSTAYNRYSAYSGTSMASPHVAGAVALCSSIAPELTANQIKAAIMDSAIDTPSMESRVVSKGRLNVKGMAEICAAGAKCGNGQVDAGEEDCDNSFGLTQLPCTDSRFGSFLSGMVTCSPSCTFDTSGCSNQTPPPTNSPTVSSAPSSSLNPTRNYGAVNFDFATGYDGWTIVSGTFTNVGTTLKSSGGADSQCDRIKSPTIRLTNASTLSISTSFDIESRSKGTWWDRANIALYYDGQRQIVVPDGGRSYNVGGKTSTNFACAGNGDDGQAGLGELGAVGWADSQTSWVTSTWSAAALGLNLADGDSKEVQIDVYYGTDESTAGTGFSFDDVVVTDAFLLA